MRFDKFTTKFQQAFADAQSSAVGHDNPYIEPQHVLSALLQQEDGGTASLLSRAGVNVPALKTALTAAIGRLPKVEGQGGEVNVSRELTNLLNLTDKEAQKLGDQFIASEMFFLALAHDKGDTGRLLKQHGGTRAALEQAVKAVRGGEKVDSAEARPRSTRASRNASSTTKSPSRSKASACCRSTWRCCWRAPSIAASSRNGLNPC